MVLKYYIFCLLIVFHVQIIASECEDEFTSLTRIRNQIQTAENQVVEIRNQTENQITDIQNRIDGWKQEMSEIQERQIVQLIPLFIQSVDILDIKRPSAKNLLKLQGVKSLGDLVIRTKNELLQKHGVGRKTVDAFENELEKRGLSLGMKVNWPLNLEQIAVLKINVLDLGNRIDRVLEAEDIQYVGDVVQSKHSDLLSINSFGRTSLDGVIEKIEELNSRLGTELHLGMTIQGWSNLRPQPVVEPSTSNKEEGQEHIAPTVTKQTDSEQVGIESTTTKETDLEQDSVEPTVTKQTNSEQPSVEQIEPKRAIPEFPLHITVKQLIFTKPTFDALKVNGISNLLQLIVFTEEELSNLPGVRLVHVDEMKKKLEEIDLSLGVNDRTILDRTDLSEINLIGDFVQPREFTPTEKESRQIETRTEEDLNSLLDLRLDSLDFSMHLQNIFKEMEFKHIGDVVSYSAEDYQSLSNFNKALLDELTIILSGLGGLHLAMDIGNWRTPILTIREVALESELNEGEAIDDKPAERVEGVTREELDPDSEMAFLDKAGEGSENYFIQKHSLIQQGESVYFTSEFSKWMNRKRGLHSEFRNKIIKLIDRFDNKGINGLGRRGVTLEYMRDGLSQWKGQSRSRGSIRIYFTIKDDELYLLLGEKSIDSREGKNRNIEKAKHLMKEYELL